MNHNKKIVIATDHRGFALKEYLKTVPTIEYEENNFSISWVDVGAFSSERSDYPIFAQHAIQKMHQESVDGAILLCGSGNGMAIAANRFKGVFACVAWNPEVARQAKEDDNCNVLVIPADYVTQKEIIFIISFWLQAEFKGGRYAERLTSIDSV
jgi:ribose 5-phosphate isomerase B